MPRFKALRPGTVTATTTYDTAIGNGVDVNGLADLPLRSGAKYIFVGSGGSDANSGLTHALRKATISGAKAIVTSGAGDQVLVAQGTTLTAAFNRWTDNAGFSALYPLCIRSYDPADPTNTALYGRATGATRPKWSATDHDMAGGGTTTSYFAFQGLEFNPGNVSTFYGVAMIEKHSYTLWENCIFAYTGFSADNSLGGTNTTGAQNATKLIFRKNVVYGAWGNARPQGMYVEGWDGFTLEDNVFYHGGWKIGGSRDDSAAAGGADSQTHNIYLDNLVRNSTVRRNLVMDGSSHGIQQRGGGDNYYNVYIENPINIQMGGGDAADIYSPTGVDFNCHHNLVLGGADINTANPRGWGIGAANGRSGSSIHHNMMLRSNLTSTALALITKAEYDQDSYVTWDNNLIYLWANTEKEDTLDYPARIHATYSNNIWGSASSGTNTNNSGFTGPNLYTAAQMYVALGYADKAAFVAAKIADTAIAPGEAARALMFTGYGRSSS